MALKDYYALLEIAPTASPDDVKRAFRGQIAKYHPDKVQHLGREFQAMAAERAAELTEAYRILSDSGRRAEYDQAFAAGGGRAAAAQSPPPPSPTVQTDPRHDPSDAAPGGAGAPDAAPRVSAQFTNERASKDQFVRRATMSRLRQALEAIGDGMYDESDVRGFDIACVPKKKLFASNRNPRLLGRFVAVVDREAIADAWAQAAKWHASADVCVLLMGTSLAPAAELAAEIGDQRRKHGRSSGALTLIPVDARDWEARMPLDAPPIAKTLLARLKKGA